MKIKFFQSVIIVLMCACVLMASGCGSILGSSEEPSATDDITEQNANLNTIEGLIEASELQYPATNEDFRYNVYTHYITISECLTAKSDIKIPDEIEGLPVIAIEPATFRNNTNLISLNMGQNIAMIGTDAFNGCTNLETVKVSPKLVSIGKSAFYECYSLSDIVIPGGVTEILQYTFFKCTNLKTVTIEPGNGEERIICKYAFSSCANLAHAWIPDDIVTIEKYAFDHSMENLMVYGYAASAAAVYSAQNLLDFTVMNKDDYANVVAAAQSDAPSIGDTIEGGRWSITLTQVQEYLAIDTYNAQENSLFLSLSFSVQNLTNQDMLFNPLYIETQVDGISENALYLTAEIGEKSLLCGTVPAGQTLQGFILYEVNEDWNNIKINFYNIDEFNVSESYFRFYNSRPQTA